MTKMFFIGVVLTSICSWLLAVALISHLVVDRQLTQNEMLMAFISAVVFTIVVVIPLINKNVYNYPITTTGIG